MAYYEAYYDEELDEELDEDFYEDYDEAAEDYDESAEGFGEARSRRPRSRRTGRKGRRGRQPGRSRIPSRKPARSSGQVAKSNEVEKAFTNVQEDMTKVHQGVKVAEVRQSNEMLNDLGATFLLRTQLITATPVIFNADDKGTVMLDPANGAPIRSQNQVIRLVDKDGNIIQENGQPVTTIGYKIDDQFMPTMAYKLLNSMKGVSGSKGYEKFLPLAAAVALSPSAQKEIGLRDENSQSGSLFGGSNNNKLGLLLLLFVLFMKK